MSVHATKEGIVDTGWVESRLDEFRRDDPGFRLLEVDMDPDVYDDWHVPGAVCLDWENDLAGELGRDVVSRHEFEELAGDCGITEETTVVLYGDEANWFAAHAYWLFTYYGHDDVRLVDGGRHNWEWNDRTVTDETVEFSQRSYTAAAPDESVRAQAEDVEAAIQEETPIIDVRNPREYRGESPPADIPKTSDTEGHIPGAENTPWMEAVDADGTFKPREELREIYDFAVDGEEAIAYCRIGERSSHTWFVLSELLDIDAANYDGSWTEWSQREDAPVETGDEPTSGSHSGRS